MKGMNILVTGATGNVGAATLESLLAAGADVRAGDYRLEGIHSRFGAAVEAAEFDFKRPATFGPALAGVERLFLMRPPAISDVQTYLFPAIDAALAVGVRQVVFLSLIGIEKATFVPHYKVEQQLIAAGMPYTFLRASFFMQNFNTMHREEIVQRNEISVPVGKAKTSFIDVRDIGAVAAKALMEADHTGQAYELTGPEALDYYEVARRFSVELGRPIVYRNPSLLRFLLRQRAQGTPWAFALVMAGLYLSTRFGMADKVTGEVQRLLGRPPITLDQYLADYRASWLDGGAPAAQTGVPASPA